MGLLNDAPAGISEIKGCKHCAEGIMSKETAAMVKASKVNVDFSYDGERTSASGRPLHGKSWEI